MKEIKMKTFTIYWKDGEENKSAKIVATDFATALKAKFGNSLPDITNVYSDEVTVYINE